MRGVLMVFFAHSTDRAEWQPLPEHLLAVAALAAARGEKFGAAKAAALAGLLHDLGKYTIAFRKRLEGSAMPVDHSTAGAKEVRNLATGGLDRGVAELIAYAIVGHHAGLPDGIGGAGRSDAHPSELQSLMRQSYAGLRLKKK